MHTSITPHPPSHYKMDQIYPPPQSPFLLLRCCAVANHSNSSGLNKTGPHTHIISAVILQRLLYYNTKEWRAYTLALHTIYNSIIYLIKDIQLLTFLFHF